ncbi:DinB family protein [Catenuloplanes indicus]|uniref:Damage-inducible protein DinB n=1 Tax=Catenuloplanes indicus TaxID=137267 RepID=A0AAE3W3D8_9ACTN|nr:DinB family protein [Catenuloplanes indicus]MDQ0369053.1 putative damage-inducible protein DinB [Catenuloplanes indicus]
MTTDWTAPVIERASEPFVAPERQMLEGWLDWHRQTLLTKCAGLTAEQLKTASVEPSILTLLGLVRHMAEVERWWFRVFTGVAPDLEDIYCTPEQRDGDFENVADADAERDFATFIAETEEARAAVKGVDLDHIYRHPTNGTEKNLRWIYVHMIEEYARHNGHADFLRERIDGVTGD